MVKLKNELKVISIILGTTIGAGFASGKEIYNFFKVFGKYGILGVLISSVFTGIIIYCVINISKRYNMKNNDEFIKKICYSNNYRVQKILSRTLRYIINIFLIISFLIMIAGWSAYFKQRFEIPIFLSSFIIGALLYCTFIKNIEGITKLNTLIVPILVIAIIYISIRMQLCNKANLQEICDYNGKYTLIKAIVSALIYSSYNSIILIPIIISINNLISSNKQLNKVVIITILSLIVLALEIIKLLNYANFNIENTEMPILLILAKQRVQEIIYGLVIIIAIFTSAVSAGFGFLENITNKRKYKKIAIILCLAGIPVSYIGFGKLVTILYPIFGIIGLIQIILIFKQKYYCKKRQKLI